jgi:cytochrome c oxidase subunit IV
MTSVLVTLNFLDVLISFYAIDVLAFMELNPLAVGFPIWIFILKFGVCFVPIVCAYVLDKFGMKNYLILPFICSVILMEFYAFVVAYNVSNILGV